MVLACANLGSFFNKRRDRPGTEASKYLESRHVPMKPCQAPENVDCVSATCAPCDREGVAAGAAADAWC